MSVLNKNLVDAKAAIKAYKKIVHKLPGNKSNTRAIWFSLEQIETFVAKLKKERDLLTRSVPPHTDNPGQGVTDGVRIYMAVYPDNYEREDYRGRNTIFMVSTIKGKQIGENQWVHHDYFNDLDLEGAEDKLEKNLALHTDPENTGELSPPAIKGSEEFLPWD